MDSLEKSCSVGWSTRVIELLSSSEKNSFSLRGQLTKVSENQSDVQLHFEGDFNPMMAMMVKKPLTKFIESLILNIHKL